MSPSGLPERCPASCPSGLCFVPAGAEARVYGPYWEHRRLRLSSSTNPDRAGAILSSNVIIAPWRGEHHVNEPTRAIRLHGLSHQLRPSRRRSRGCTREYAGIIATRHCGEPLMRDGLHAAEKAKSQIVLRHMGKELRSIAARDPGTRRSGFSLNPAPHRLGVYSAAPLSEARVGPASGRLRRNVLRRAT
jgi:hypothetical protein